MTPDEALEQVAERYRKDGYEVTVKPTPADLPEPLRRDYPAAVARRNGTRVLIEVWERDRVHALPPDPLPTGWSYDTILMPRPGFPDTPGAAATPEFADRLLTELEELVPRGAVKARFLLAWSAVEAAMRVSAQRAGLDPERLTPREVMSELVSAGVLSEEQFGRLERQLAVRNRVSHGVPVEPIDPVAIDQMVALAKGLLSPTAPVPSA